MRRTSILAAVVAPPPVPFSFSLPIPIPIPIPNFACVSVSFRVATVCFIPCTLVASPSLFTVIAVSISAVARTRAMPLTPLVHG